MANEACAGHCWHYITGWSNGMGSAGEDTEQCCWCGETRVRPWKSGKDHRHGNYHAETIKVYAEAK